MSKVFKSLPLFRLPTILLRKISRYMDLKEIFMVSLASKKSALIIGSLLPPNLFELEIKLSEESKASVSAKRHWIYPLVIKRKGVYGQPFAQQFCDTCSQWAGRDSVKSLLSHLAIVFNPTISIAFDWICDQEFVMEVMNHVKQLNLVKKSIHVSCDSPLSPENYKYILDECKTVSELSLFRGISSDFEYRARPDFKVDDFFVSDGRWMHFEDFSNCKTVNIHQKPDYINLEALKALIKKWIESDCRLEHFTVSSHPATFDFKSVLQGLGTIEQNSIFSGVEITRGCDGKKAIVKCGSRNFFFNVID